LKTQARLDFIECETANCRVSNHRTKRVSSCFLASL